MNKQEEFEKAIKNNNLDLVSILLMDSEVDPAIDKNKAIGVACSLGYVELVKILLNDKRVDPSDNDSLCFLWASRNSQTEIVKLLLKDKRSNPTLYMNTPISQAFFGKNQELFNVLWDDLRIKNSLEKNHIEFYNQLMDWKKVKR